MGKTCGECKHLNRELAFCRACGAKWLNDSDGANCKYFEKLTPPTNGDRIRRGGNQKLLGYRSTHKCDICIYAAPIDVTPACNRPDGKSCMDGMESWLNAPAESGVGEMSNNSKFCVNCRHHVRTALTPCGSDFCKTMRNPVTGNPMPCLWARSNPDMCGKEGRYFDIRGPAPQKTNFWLRIFRGKANELLSIAESGKLKEVYGGTE